MEPRSRSVLWDEPELEEPIEVTDYYDAMRMEWLSRNFNEEVSPDHTPGVAAE